MLRSLDCPLDPLEEQDALFDLAQAMSTVSGAPAKRSGFDYVAAQRAREYIHSALDRTVTLDELAQHSGRDRWSLSRDFRLLFGTSPYRYLTMRRLDMVRALLIQGQSTGQRRADRRLHRPEPHDPAIQQNLRPVTGPLDEHAAPLSHAQSFKKRVESLAIVGSDQPRELLS